MPKAPYHYERQRDDEFEARAAAGENVWSETADSRVRTRLWKVIAESEAAAPWKLVCIDSGRPISRSTVSTAFTASPSDARVNSR